MELSREEIYSRHLYYAPELVAPSAREIDFIDIKPQPLIVQIPLVEYLERVKRYKADAWQKDFCNRLQTAAENRHIKRYWAIFHAEGQLGKTSIMSQVFPAWLFGHDPLFRFALAMYNETRSEEHSDVVINILKSQVHRDIFPNKDGWLESSKPSKEGWKTKARRELNDGQESFNPVGLQSGLTGSGFDWLSIDDPYKTEKEAFSDTVRRNMASFYEFTVMSRTGLHACITGMFHRYAPEDFAGFLLDTGDFDYVRYATQADGDYYHEKTGQKFTDPLNREIGEYISPERRPPHYYEKPRKNKRAWLSMFQGRPSAEEGEFFNVGRIQTISREEGEERRAECVAFVRAYDNAATSGGGAYSVGALMGIRPNGKITVFEIWREQLDSAARLKKQQSTAEKDGKEVAITVPNDPGAAGTDVVWYTKQKLEGYTVVERSTSGSKEDRARNFSDAVNSGDVEFVDDSHLPEERRWNTEAKKEMRDFPLSEFKDIVDAESDGYNYLYEIFRKGLVVKNFRPQRNLVLWSDFANRFPYYEGESLALKIPANFTIYAGVKIQEASRPTSAIIVARAPVNSGLSETLFVVAEYKAYDGDFYALFEWLERSLAVFCEKTGVGNTTVWMHRDSDAYAPTIRQKLKVQVRIFEHAADEGLTEMNWYLLPTEMAHPFNDLEQASRLYFLIQDGQFDSAKDEYGLPSARQEIATWNYNDKGEPSATGAVMECLRMVTFSFRTSATPLSKQERREEALPSHVKREVVESIEDLEMKERLTLQRMIEFGKLDEREKALKRKTSKYRPSIPGMKPPKIKR